MVVGEAEQTHGEDRVGHGRVDCAETAGEGEALLQPTTGRVHRASTQGTGRKALPDLEPVVDREEEVLPEPSAQGPRLGRPLEAEARLFAGDRPQLVER